MCRYQERDVTKIRNEKTTKKVVGYDANGLYAWTMLQDMPTGQFRVRRKDNNFQLDIPPRWQGAHEWLSWKTHETGMNIETAYNGKEHNVLTYKLDGFCKENNTILEFHGCWYHGCFVRLEKRKQIKTVYFSKVIVTAQRVERVLCVLWVITLLRYSNVNG